jgi:hypothetical protein
MQDRRSEDLRVFYATLLSEHARDRERMVDIRRTCAILSSLITMLVRSKCSGMQEQRDGLTHWYLPRVDITLKFFITADWH